MTLAMENERMNCPRCNTTMNRHAEKPVEPVTHDEAMRVAEGGFVIEEAHRCPNCGDEESRRLVLG